MSKNEKPVRGGMFREYPAASRYRESVEPNMAANVEET
jgi:hypothetical protein